MSDDWKLSRYEWTIYITEELLKCELMDLVREEDDESNYRAFKKGRADAYRSTLYDLTENEKWLKSLEQLEELLLSTDEISK